MLFDSPSPVDQRAARAICSACPVLVACQGWVGRMDENEDPGGVCGGWTEFQRVRARRRQAQLKQPPEVTTVAKQCRLCRHLKQPDQFYRNADSPDGLRNECRNCYGERRTGKKATA